jgi:hypothetical protein
VRRYKVTRPPALPIPVNTVAPVISGTASVGSTLTVTSNGTWTNTPTGFAFQWYRDNGTTQTAIPGATSSTYVLVSADKPNNIYCQVAASNASGIGLKNSNSLGPVTDSLAAPVLTQTSTAGTNPPTWNATMANLQDGDTIELYYTEDGSAPVANGSPQGTHIANGVEENVNWGTAWPNPFPGGTTIKWAERYGRVVGGVMEWSPLSNILSDTMPASGATFVPGTAPVGQSNSATTHTFTSVAFGAGIPIVGVSAYFVTGVTLTPTGGGTAISLNLVSDIDPTRRDATIWSHAAISAGNYDVTITHSSANSDCSIHPGTLSATSATPVSTFGQAAGVSSTSYAAAETMSTGGIWIAIGHSYALSTMNWSNGTPTKDTEVQIAGSSSTGSMAHGTTSGTVTVAPSPGAFGAMVGAVFV